MKKKICDILEGIQHKLIGDNMLEITGITIDSRKAAPGALFVAQKGSSFDGHKFIPEVIGKGVRCILCEDLPKDIPSGISFILVKDSHEALGLISSNFFGNPSRKFKLVGVTGTNGKTSIATLLYRVFRNLGYKSGLLSTVKNIVVDRESDATHTTPDAISLNELLYEMAEAGCDYVFMEVSSHAVDQKRIAGLDFDGAIFTNITHDHLDYHKTFDEYIKAKKAFFDRLKPGAFALVNLDDKRGKVMVQNTLARIKTFALQYPSDFKGKVLESHFDGMLLTFNNVELWTKLIGLFNASNLLAVFGAASLLGQETKEILKIISTLETVDGRFEYLRSNNGVTAVVDYAHTPDALKNVIETINQINEGGGELITLVGAGGNRDKTKRPEMAKIAVKGSSKVILTSDNPRNEDPQSIIDDMMAGIEITGRNKVISIVNRREAIRTACLMAKSGDIILIAGKGHETYQEIKGVKEHFSDKEVVAEYFLLNQINQQ